jgi:hypothetical protein
MDRILSLEKELKSAKGRTSANGTTSGRFRVAAGERVPVNNLTPSLSIGNGGPRSRRVTMNGTDLNGSLGDGSDGELRKSTGSIAARLGTQRTASVPRERLLAYLMPCWCI